MKAQIQIVVLVSELAAALIGISCSGAAGVPNVASPVQDKSSATSTATPTVLPASTEANTLSGALIVEHQVDVAALRDGLVNSLVVDVDTPVRKGQLLATLDDRQLSADRDAAAARVRELESDVKNWAAEVKVLEADQERAERMWDAKLITKEQLDHVRYNTVADRFSAESAGHKLDSARATLRSLELELEKTRVSAPFDGVVARRYVREGQRVANGDHMFWVTSVSPLLVRLTVPERLAASVRRGQDVGVSMAEQIAPVHVARIVSVSPVIDPSSSTVEVVARVQGAPGELRSGMTVKVRLRSGK